MDVLTFALTVFTIAGPRGGTCTGWFRSANRAMGYAGQGDDLHLYGLAMDVTFDDTASKVKAITALCRADLYVRDAGDHIHVQAVEPLPTLSGDTTWAS